MANDERRFGDREGEYAALVRQFEREGRYLGREEEVAARVVNKQRREYGETREAEEQDRRGESPDRDLPISEYDGKTVDEVAAELDDLSPKQVRKIEEYEEEHKDRKTLLERLDRAHDE